MATSNGTADTPKRTPPYLPASTFLSVLEGWRVVVPNRVDRTVLTKVAGSMQTWLIAALRYLDLIDANSEPTTRLRLLVSATDSDRERLFAQMLHDAYPFLFQNGFDLSSATHGQLREKFAETGAQGETLVKAMSFFTGMAKAAGLPMSPYVSTRQRRTTPGSFARRTMIRGGPERAAGRVPSKPQDEPAVQPKTAFEVLYDLLDVEMEEAEQQAVWTLLKYLKKRGG